MMNKYFALCVLFTSCNSTIATYFTKNPNRYGFQKRFFKVSSLNEIPRGGDSNLPSESFTLSKDANPESNSRLDDLQNDSSTESISTSTLQQQSSDAVTSITESLYSIKSSMSKSDDRSILGRAVLTTPHRRMPALLIATGPKPSFTSPNNPSPIFTATPIFVTKFSLSESLGCALRDLRVIDHFSDNGRLRFIGPAFLARKNCVIVNVGHVRAIVMRNQVLVFLPEATSGTRRSGCNEASAFDEGRGPLGTSPMNAKHKQVMETIELLVEALVVHLNSIYHSSHHLFDDDVNINGSDDEKDTNLMGTIVNKQIDGEVRKSSRLKIGRNTDKTKTTKKQSRTTPTTEQTTAPPFELVVIESLLGHVCSFESNKVSKLLVTADEILSGISSNFNDKGEGGVKKDAFIEMQAKLGELLPLKNKVDQREAKCTEVAGAIAEVLKNDEDMAAMRLSEIDDNGVEEGDPKNLHVEVELLFEDYLLQMDEVLLSLRTVQNSVKNTEEVVEIELDLLRNRIMRYEMLLELSGLVVGVAAAVTGAFGMNLVNHVEEHPTMFLNVCGGLIVIMCLMGYGILRKLSTDNIF
ncbi:hypothetical protein CTEN210_07891 [Chaetoceros tenuissimus]|uniref:Magnesium transporter n=1 Tax=Chaetoceros tenuissimus TaxID=426638 RepID=A0AAD3CUR9_9STRA|nr:hypothetical protein CTEN210_07891 [Chaetoceros tenuissimus]